MTTTGTKIFYSSTNDGYVRQAADTWEEVHSATTGNSCYPGLEKNDSLASAFYNVMTGLTIDRSFFYFDTSSLPDDSVISEVVCSFYGYFFAESSVCVQQGTQADTLSMDDFDSFTGSEFGHSTGWTTSGYNAITLNQSGRNAINKTGTTKICCREYNHDYLDVTCGEDDPGDNGGYFADNPGFDKDPKLVVTYETAALTLKLHPNSDQVTNIPSSTDGHYTAVDEATPNDADYVYDDSQGGSWVYDLYGIPNHTTEIGDISSVTIYTRCYGGHASDHCRTAIKSDSTITYGAAHSPGATWTPYSVTYTTNPADSSSWTWDDVDSLQIGVSLNSYDNKDSDARCSQVYAEVEYYPVIQKSLSESLTIQEKLEKSVDLPFSEVISESPSNLSSLSYMKSGTPFLADVLSKGPNSIFRLESEVLTLYDLVGIEQPAINIGIVVLADVLKLGPNFIFRSEIEASELNDLVKKDVFGRGILEGVTLTDVLSIGPNFFDRSRGEFISLNDLAEGGKWGEEGESVVLTDVLSTGPNFISHLEKETYSVNDLVNVGIPGKSIFNIGRVTLDDCISLEESEVFSMSLQKYKISAIKKPLSLTLEITPTLLESLKGELSNSDLSLMRFRPLQVSAFEDIWFFAAPVVSAIKRENILNKVSIELLLVDEEAVDFRRKPQKSSDFFDEEKCASLPLLSDVSSTESEIIRFYIGEKSIVFPSIGVLK